MSSLEIDASQRQYFVDSVKKLLPPLQTVGLEPDYDFIDGQLECNDTLLNVFDALGVQQLYAESKHRIGAATLVLAQNTDIGPTGPTGNVTVDVTKQDDVLGAVTEVYDVTDNLKAASYRVIALPISPADPVDTQTLIARIQNHTKNMELERDFGLPTFTTDQFNIVMALIKQCDSQNRISTDEA